ncbi:hypothetical protein, variant [Pyricularia oryzae 70-15]|uniref:Peptidase S26 domain-containing protein n=1 Tax=Pyricularia oryzae (strain 70-15 / ATCC MYA-4617 / FGSC 8958) TaxID=242507 RepID=G4NGU3_PYRO7|nr:hypothetical protein, variant [Pyricularia oryzae 70-15]EHA47452.1 hypothetical protein, variant [Pyricularia oryzae 70-15]
MTSFSSRFLGRLSGSSTFFPIKPTIWVLKTFALFHVFFYNGYSYSATWGPSMLPTFEVVGEAAVINRTYRRGRNIGVGDVVAYDIPVEKKDTGMKRVIGMPGDYVLINSPESGSSEMIQVRRAKILQPPLLYFLFSGSLSPF